jgi:hypothetical protein
MNKGLTPEERLLRLIKEGVNAEQDQTPAEQAASTTAVSATPPAPESAPSVETEVAARQKRDIRKFFTFTNINRLLTVMFFLILLYAIFGLVSLVFSRPGLIDAGSGVAEGVVSVSGGQNDVSKRTLEYYLAQIGKRDLFKSVILDDTKTAGQVEPLKLRIDELTKSLVLKGIIAGDVPQAVVEDTKAGKTYFVIKQDKIGDASVDDIKNDRVRLKIDGQTFELVL